MAPTDVGVQTPKDLIVMPCWILPVIALCLLYLDIIYGAYDFIAYWRNKKYFFDFSTKTYVVGTQKIHLIETVILGTQNKSCADLEGGGGDRGSRPPWKITKI